MCSADNCVDEYIIEVSSSNHYLVWMTLYQSIISKNRRYKTTIIAGSCTKGDRVVNEWQQAHPRGAGFGEYRCRDHQFNGMIADKPGV